MHGPTRCAGSVGGVRNIKNVSLVAKAVMEHTGHVMLVGEGAERLRWPWASLAKICSPNVPAKSGCSGRSTTRPTIGGDRDGRPAMEAAGITVSGAIRDFAAK